MRHFRISIFNHLDTCEEEDVAMFIEQGDLPFEFSRWILIHNACNISRYISELKEIYEDLQNRNS